jgi:NAD(P)-dependent dehydrogenase (short-subunit alcohol dehydrogenase family)
VAVRSSTSRRSPGCRACPASLRRQQVRQVASDDFADVDQEAVYASLPIPRIGTPGDVTHVMVFLASDESAYCTGGELVVDGGAMAGPPMPGIVDTA